MILHTLKILILLGALNAYCALGAKSQSFTDSLVFGQTATIQSFGIDSTGHWWVVVEPYTHLKQIVIDGEVLGPYDSLQTPIFSVDGTSWAFVATRNGEWRVVTQSDSIVSPNRISELGYVFRSNRLIWYETNGADKKIVTRTRNFPVQGILQVIKTDLTGNVVCWTEVQNGQHVLFRNGQQVESAENIRLVGVWYSGDPLYAKKNGIAWSMQIGTKELCNNQASISEAQLNTTADVCAWIASQIGMGSRAMIYRDDYTVPWEGPNLDGAYNLALSPLDALVAYFGIFGIQRSVYYNGTPYPAGRETGAPFFTANGVFMIYAGTDSDQFVSVNGKRIRINSSAPKNNTFAVSPNGEIVCWNSASTMVMADLEFNTIQMGKMCDEVTDVIYHSVTNTFKALGRVSGRIYLLTATPR